MLHQRPHHPLASHADLLARGVTFSAAPHVIHRHPDGAVEGMAFFKDDEDRDLALHSVVAALSLGGLGQIIVRRSIAF